MKRDPTRLTDGVFDLLIIGGGIYGACVAWDAVLRGLSVALVEKADFCSATSSNSLKIIHGGFRYLKNADFRRMRTSITERRNLMQMAPHLVHTLPVLIPTYGHWMQDKLRSSVALAVNDLVGLDRNRSSNVDNRIPRGRVVSQNDILELLPGINPQGLNGGMLFYDAQADNTERLVISILKSADAAGATLANYVKATGFLMDGNLVIGIHAKDVLSGDLLEIRSRTVINTTGPWTDQTIESLGEPRLPQRSSFVKAMNLVTCPIFRGYAAGLLSKRKCGSSDAIVDNGGRYLFVTPWRNQSLIGTYYKSYDGEPDDFGITMCDVEDFLDEINQVLPSALSMNDVSFVHGGLVPTSEAHAAGAGVRRGESYSIIDHRHEKVHGLISVVGLKYTTARSVAEKVIDLVFRTWDRRAPESRSSTAVLYGGEMESFQKYVLAEVKRNRDVLPEEKIRLLISTYGSAYHEVLQHAEDMTDLPGVDRGHSVMRAEILHAVRQEMAQKLGDAVFRRTDIGSAGRPPCDVLMACADTMGAELGWSTTKTQREISEVEERYLMVGGAR